jgi:hypothetical protein
LSNARSRGVSDELIERVEGASKDRHAFFLVRRLDAVIDAEKKRVLEEGISYRGCTNDRRHHFELQWEDCDADV